MKQLLFVALIAFGAYKGWSHFHHKGNAPLFEEPYVVVYGRDSCGYTRATRDRLTKAGIEFVYLSVDDRDAADSLHARMQNAGLDTRHYLLPVVDLNNHISIRPDNDDLVAEAKDLSL